MPDNELWQAVVDHCHACLLKSRQATRRLQKLRLSDSSLVRHFKLGYADGSLLDKLSATQKKQLKDFNSLNGQIIVPCLDLDGGISAFTSLTEPQTLIGSASVFNTPAIPVYRDSLIITDSIPDTLRLWHPKYGNCQNVVAALDAESLSEVLKAHDVRKVTLTFEHAELAATLTQDGIKVHRIKWPKGCHGVADYFQYDSTSDFRGNDETFSTLLTSAPQVGFKRDDKTSLVLSERSDNGAIFNHDNLSYAIRGIKHADDLKVLLTVETEGRRFTDRVDLHAHKSRKSFSVSCAERLQLKAEDLQVDLLELLNQLEQRLEAEAQESNQKTRVEPMSESDEKAALAYLKSSKLLNRIVCDLEAIGHIGEKENKQLVYIVATSRRLPKPLSAIVRSQSGAGKSYLMECVADLMPPEDVQFFSRLTPQALYYLEADALKHKLLIVDERNGSEDSEYPIRTLQTKRQLRLAVPLKDPSSGKTKTETLQINGPIAFMESTTSQKINPENENRCFEIYLDESEQQTERIFEAQRKTRTITGRSVEVQKKNTLRIHHHAQRLLRPLKVTIPYVEQIVFPRDWLRARRDHDRFLSLIEGVAFLHQYQRNLVEADGQEYIEASLDDYAIAYRLAHRVFANSVGELAKPIQDFLGNVEKTVKELAKEQGSKVDEITFTRRQIRERLNLPDYLIKRYMRQIEDLEYIAVKRAPSGGSFRYRLLSGKGKTSALNGLITPKELAQRIRASGTSGSKAELARNHV